MASINLINKNTSSVLIADRIHQERVGLELLVDPVLLARLVATELLRLEPQGDLLVGGLHSVGPVADVAANLDRQELRGFSVQI